MEDAPLPRVRTSPSWRLATRWPDVALIALIAGATWAYASDIHLFAAWRGFSPLDYVYRSAEAHNFARDFPNGVAELGNSAFMRIYPAAFRWFGFSPETLLPFVVGLEVIALVAALVLLVRALFPRSSPALVTLVAALVVASRARNMNLARFAQPFFVAQFYNIADVLRVLAIVMAVRHRSVAAAAFAAAAFVTHPVLGLIGAVFVTAALLVPPLAPRRRRLCFAAALFATVALVWSVGVVDVLSSPPGGTVEDEAWFRLTRFGSVHWFPVDYGLLHVKHEERLLPFLSFLLLFLGTIARNRPLRDVDRRVVAGCGAMGVLVVVGVLVSVTTPNQTLVKLSLHRANDLILLVGLVYVAQGLWADVSGGPAWRRLVAAYALLSPFLLSPGFPLVASLLLVTPVAVREARGPTPAWGRALLGTAVAVLALVVVYVLAGLVPTWQSDALTGIATVRDGGWRAVVALAAVLALGVVPGTIARAVEWRSALAVLSVVALALGWLSTNRLFDDGEERKRASDYLAAQKWARTHTAEIALFMPDPSHYYGWRDYARRSSFGNLREWIHNAFAYTSDASAYQLGLRRFAELGLDLDEYMDERPPRGFSNLTKDARKVYYGAPTQWFEGLAARHAIDYFVFDKTYLKGRRPVPAVYENRTFVIARPRGAGDGNSPGRDQ